ncbi:TPA: hypothetical protein DEP58_04725 [Patescibacteria group bacterium]|nr:hypothetical protein [Patescibacteria group bacterium]
MAFTPLGPNGLQVQTSQAQASEDVLFVRGLEHKVSYEDLLAMTVFVLTGTPLKEKGDARLAFLETIRTLHIVCEGEEKRLDFPISEKA